MRYQIELANRIVCSRCVGTEYVVTRRPDGYTSILARFDSREDAAAWIDRATLAAWANDPAIPGAPVLTADSPAADVLAWLVAYDPNGEYDGGDFGPVTDPWRCVADVREYAGT